MAHAMHHQLAHHLDWYAAGGRLVHKGMAHPVRAGFFRTGADRARHPREVIRQGARLLAIQYFDSWFWRPRPNHPIGLGLSDVANQCRPETRQVYSSRMTHAGVHNTKGPACQQLSCQ